MTETIFALSSGSPPAGIAVIRMSGIAAGTTLTALSGKLPQPRRATLAWIADPTTGDRLDHALILWFPGPDTVTGEDLAEIHLHGGRAVVASVLGALGRQKGLRGARPGEFTRRAFDNGRIDLAEAEGLADLLAAETESQRRNALRMADGALGKMVIAWQSRIIHAAALIEATLDFSDEADVDAVSEQHSRAIAAAVQDEISIHLTRPGSDRLRDGVRVVIAGPPNAGKSTLLNALVGREAAIVTELAGTTRDLIEIPIAIAGVALVLIDSAGLRDGEGVVEQIGIERARAALDMADIILWLDAPHRCPVPDRAINVVAKGDAIGCETPDTDAIVISARTGAGMERLIGALLEKARILLPAEGDVALNARQRSVLMEVVQALGDPDPDAVVFAEQLRFAYAGFDRLTGKAGVENLLDALFGSFCIGK